MVRLTVDVSPGLNQALVDIANDNGITKAEAFRRTIILADIAHEAIKAGKHIGVVDDPDKLQKVFVGI